jgi:hypothetical protein
VHKSSPFSLYTEKKIAAANAAAGQSGQGSALQPGKELKPFANPRFPKDGVLWLGHGDSVPILYCALLQMFCRVGSFFLILPVKPLIVKNLGGQSGAFGETGKVLLFLYIYLTGYIISDLVQRTPMSSIIDLKKPLGGYYVNFTYWQHDSREQHGMLMDR